MDAELVLVAPVALAVPSPLLVPTVNFVVERVALVPVLVVPARQHVGVVRRAAVVLAAASGYNADTAEVGTGTVGSIPKLRSVGAVAVVVAAVDADRRSKKNDAVVAPGALAGAVEAVPEAALLVAVLLSTVFAVVVLEVSPVAGHSKPQQRSGTGLVHGHSSHTRTDRSAL